MSLTDTIAAISTPIGAGGIGIVRISGGEALAIGKKIFSGNLESVQSHSILHGFIKDGKNDGCGFIDEVLLAVMLAPRTYTREDVIEINCHGGIKSLQAVLGEVLKNGARLAEPGEFTKRAFLNGRIDISQAEAVKDIIGAKTELSRRAALSHLRGALSAKISTYREEMLTMIAYIEASIDYPEHELEEMNIDEVSRKTEALIQKLEKLIDTTGRGRIIREGIETVIIGRPNVGKSSLLNVIVQEDRAIVTDIPGTTRDILREYINIRDIPLHIADTAGIRETSDTIENIGVMKSKACAENADLIFLVLDGSQDLAQEDIEILNFVSGRRVIVLVNKSDLPLKLSRDKIGEFMGNGGAGDVIYISTVDGAGMDELYNRITELFFNGEISPEDELIMASLRQGDSIRKAREALGNVMDAINAGMTEELLTIDLLGAYRFLGEVIGDTLEEDVIDKIFSEFCLGK